MDFDLGNFFTLSRYHGELLVNHHSERTPASTRLLRSLSAKPTWFDTIRSNVAPHTGHCLASASLIATLQLPHRMLWRSTSNDAVFIVVLDLRQLVELRNFFKLHC